MMSCIEQANNSRSFTIMMRGCLAKSANWHSAHQKLWSTVQDTWFYCITPKPPLNGEYISNWPPWRIRHCTLANHFTCTNCYNIMNPHRLCNLPLLFNSLFHDTTLNLDRVHFKSQHQNLEFIAC